VGLPFSGIVIVYKSVSKIYLIGALLGKAGRKNYLPGMIGVISINTGEKAADYYGKEIETSTLFC
jgi:hypothetical protein